MYRTFCFQSDRVRCNFAWNLSKERNLSHSLSEFLFDYHSIFNFFVEFRSQEKVETFLRFRKHENVSENLSVDFSILLEKTNILKIQMNSHRTDFSHRSKLEIGFSFFSKRCLSLTFQKKKKRLFILTWKILMLWKKFHSIQKTKYLCIEKKS